MSPGDREVEPRPVSLYGDSYGTFFTQAFAGGTPTWCAASCSTAPTRPTASRLVSHPGPGHARRVRQGLPPVGGVPVRRAGFVPTLRTVLHGCGNGPGGGRRRRRGHPCRGDGGRRGPDQRRVRGDVRTGVLPRATAALRSGLRGDRAPLLRLVAEAVGGSSNAGPVRAYSEGLDAAVACHDYPQLYDMTSPPGAARERQLDRADQRAGSHAPAHLRPVHRPRVRRLRLAGARLVHPLAGRGSGQPGGADPSVGRLPRAPVLVLSGELDSITTAAEGDLVTGQFPNARHVVVHNSFHVTAVGDRDDCAERILRAFVRSPGSESRLLGCAREVEPVRALGMVPRTLADVGRPLRSERCPPGPARRSRGGAHRRRRGGSVVEQLLGQRRRSPRRHLQLYGLLGREAA